MTKILRHRLLPTTHPSNHAYIPRYVCETTVALLKYKYRMMDLFLLLDEIGVGKVGVMGGRSRVMNERVQDIQCRKQ